MNLKMKCDQSIKHQYYGKESKEMDFSSLNFLLGLKYLKWEKQDSFYWEDKEGF